MELSHFLLGFVSPQDGVRRHEVVFRKTLILGIIFCVHTVKSSRHNTCFRVQYGTEPESYSTMGNICMAGIQALKWVQIFKCPWGFWESNCGLPSILFAKRTPLVCPFEGLGKVLRQNYHIRTRISSRR